MDGTGKTLPPIGGNAIGPNPGGVGIPAPSPYPMPHPGFGTPKFGGNPPQQPPGPMDGTLPVEKPGYQNLISALTRSNWG
jgi:hypothetical protein